MVSNTFSYCKKKEPINLGIGQRKAVFAREADTGPLGEQQQSLQGLQDS